MAVLLSETGVPVVSLSYLWQCCCLRWWCPCGVPVISVAVLLSETGVPVVSLSYLWQCCCLRWWCPCGVPVISVAVLFPCFDFMAQCQKLAGLLFNGLLFIGLSCIDIGISHW